MRPQLEKILSSGQAALILSSTGSLRGVIDSAEGKFVVENIFYGLSWLFIFLYCKPK
jgi:hypothetical protein